MSKTFPRLTITAVIAAMMACACALAFAVPQKAHAGELQPASITTQTNNNLTTGKAKPIKPGSSAMVKFSKSDMENSAFPNAYYWYSYRHSNRASAYTIRVDSLDAVKCAAAFYDEDVKELKNVNLPSNGGVYATTFSYKVDSSDGFGKQRYIKVATGHSWYGTSWSEEINEGSSFKVTVTEHPFIKQVTGVKASKKAKKFITLKWNKQANATKYQVKWKKKGGSWKTVTLTKNSKKFSKLKRNTKYQFKVRAYCKNGYDVAKDKTANWSAWSRVKTVKTNK